MTEQKQQSTKQRVTLYIDRDVLRLSKAKAAMREVSLSYLVELLLREAIANNGNGVNKSK